MNRETKYYKVLRKDRLLILIHDVCGNCPPNEAPIGAFARLIKCSTSTIYRFVNEDYNELSAKLVYDIAKKTGVSVDWLYGLSDEMYRDGKEQKSEEK